MSHISYPHRHCSPTFRPALSTAIALLISVLGVVPLAFAQVESPSGEEIFREDLDAIEKQRTRRVKQLMQTDTPTVGQIDVRAPQLEYLQNNEAVKGSGGLVVSSGGVQLQADEGVVNLQTKDASLSGNFYMSGQDGSIAADRAEINIDNEVGDFWSADFSLEGGEYQVQAGTAKKLSDIEYKLSDSIFTTCDCADGSTPWCFKSQRSNITREGYAHNYHSRFEVGEYPVFYTPWIAFPVKRERASGLMAPEYGYGSEDGVQFKIPLYVVVDDYSDFTFTPFIETKTRRGMGIDYRHALSTNHSLDARFVYSDERPRDDNLRGTNVSGLSDPGFDDHRFGGYYSQSWSSDSSSAIDGSLFADIHLVSDDLFLREIEDPEIGKRNARYTVSKLIGRAALGTFGLAELGGEFNQAIIEDDDLVFQRMPELSVSGSQSFRPFGYNPYGLKFVTGAEIRATNFNRKEGYDGTRLNINPKVRVPFHYKNYMNSELSLGIHQTYYQQDETLFPNQAVPADGSPLNELDSSNDRSVFTLDYRVSTELERVIDVDPDGTIAYLTSFGVENQDDRLRRMKHTVEPYVKYSYIPEEEQDDLPLYDSLDRFREKNLFTYGFRTAMLGRFGALNAGEDDIPELTPQIEDLPVLDTRRALSDVGAADSFGALGSVAPVRRGNIREIAYLDVKQSFDYHEEKRNEDPNRRPFSDVNLGAGLFPVRNFGMRIGTNYDVEKHDVASWELSSSVRDDRGDALRVRYSYVETNVSQIEGNAELVLTDRLRVGGYGRYDEIEQEFIESEAALRISSKCNCWHLDFGYSTRINPDREKFLLTFTLRGLGDLTQDFRLDEDDNR